MAVSLTAASRSSGLARVGSAGPLAGLWHRLGGRFGTQRLGLAGGPVLGRRTAY